MAAGSYFAVRRSSDSDLISSGGGQDQRPLRGGPALMGEVKHFRTRLSTHQTIAIKLAVIVYTTEPNRSKQGVEHEQSEPSSHGEKAAERNMTKNKRSG